MPNTNTPSVFVHASDMARTKLCRPVISAYSSWVQQTLCHKVISGYMYVYQHALTPSYFNFRLVKLEEYYTNSKFSVEDIMCKYPTEFKRSVIIVLPLLKPSPKNLANKINLWPFDPVIPLYLLWNRTRHNIAGWLNTPFMKIPQYDGVTVWWRRQTDPIIILLWGHRLTMSSNWSCNIAGSMSQYYGVKPVTSRSDFCYVWCTIREGLGTRLLTTLVQQTPAVDNFNIKY